ncbi:hypothetical protein D3C80_1505620 [compost metagenome]
MASGPPDLPHAAAGFDEEGNLLLRLSRQVPSVRQRLVDLRLQDGAFFVQLEDLPNEGLGVVLRVGIVMLMRASPLWGKRREQTIRQ